MVCAYRRERYTAVECPDCVDAALTAIRRLHTPTTGFGSRCSVCRDGTGHLKVWPCEWELIARNIDTSDCDECVIEQFAIIYQTHCRVNTIEIPVCRECSSAGNYVKWPCVTLRIIESSISLGDDDAIDLMTSLKNAIEASP